MRSRPAVLVVVAICCCALAGCFEWTEDQSGNLQSVGMPGVPFWKAKKPGPPQSLTDTGMTPEEATKVSGPVLVVPPDQSSTDTALSLLSNRAEYLPAGSREDAGGSGGEQQRAGAVLHAKRPPRTREGCRVRFLNGCQVERFARK